MWIETEGFCQTRNWTTLVCAWCYQMSILKLVLDDVWKMSDGMIDGWKRTLESAGLKLPSQFMFSMSITNHKQSLYSLPLKGFVLTWMCYVLELDLCHDGLLLQSLYASELSWQFDMKSHAGLNPFGVLKWETRANVNPLGFSMWSTHASMSALGIFLGGFKSVWMPRLSHFGIHSPKLLFKGRLKLVGVALLYTRVNHVGLMCLSWALMSMWVPF